MKTPNNSANHKPSIVLQMLINVVIPIFILTTMSSESRLGATNAFLLALAFPVAFEMYSIWKRRKVSYVSLAVIGGLLVTGAIGMLGLDEGWLAVRRSVPYLFIAAVILVAQLIKRPLTGAFLGQVFDMDKVKAVAREKQVLKDIEHAMTRAAYMMCAAFVIIAIASYVLTRVIIESPTGSDAFNQEYARLRVISLPAIALPLMVAIVAVVAFLIHRIEKLTGLEDKEMMLKR